MCHFDLGGLASDKLSNQSGNRIWKPKGAPMDALANCPKDYRAAWARLSRSADQRVGVATAHDEGMTATLHPISTAVHGTSGNCLVGRGVPDGGTACRYGNRLFNPAAIALGSCRQRVMDQPLHHLVHIGKSRILRLAPVVSIVYLGHDHGEFKIGKGQIVGEIS